MNIKWLLLSSDGNLDRKTFWTAILSLNLLSLILDAVGNSIFIEIGQDRISFMMFFITKMIPRLLSIIILVFSFFIAKKRVNEINSSEWIPIFYVLTLFLPSFLQAANQLNLFMFSIILPIIITFYLGLASPGTKTN
jgi:uncharacterized membrane protein YhaH (DUF805 family)|tara:strand:+ start:133 stop:543 length:411 start_codon:yes stop_codon:yes gene_type:complete